MKYRNCLIFILIQLFLISCSSQKLIVEPVSNNTFWEQGREYVHHTDGHIELNICHEHTTGSIMVFYVELLNLDSTKIKVDPALFYYSYAVGQADSNGQITESKITGKNPEYEIRRIDKKIQDENDSYESTLAVDDVGALLGAVVGIIDLIFTDSDNEDEEDEEDVKEESTYDPGQARYEHDQRLLALEDEKYYWENEVLRRTTLSKNDHCGGFVEFIVSKNARTITVHLPAGESDLCCDFTQEWVTL
jgi:hypothetical protein